MAKNGKQEGKELAGIDLSMTLDELKGYREDIYNQYQNFVKQVNEFNAKALKAQGFIEVVDSIIKSKEGVADDAKGNDGASKAAPSTNV
tara:strand:+ start:1534 stop:1800 length:267 start_codon:yes stop_codon:yes gene_type:complete